jgi:hypothetical protein
MKKTDLYLKPGTYIKSSTTTGEVQGISLENFVVSVLNNPTCCPKPPGSPDGMLMTALPLNLTLQTVTDFVGNNSAIQLSTLRLGIRSDSSVTTQVSSVIQATTTNANLVIAPNGTGALIADIPDSTPTGGNARGDNAVDLQTYRAGAPQVASGDISVIGGGRANTASNNYSVVSGGYSNISSGQFSYVGAGTSNTASSNYSTVSGGQSNTASTGPHATVVGGQSNTSSGEFSVSGGTGNVSSNNASVSLGANNIASGLRSFAQGLGSQATMNYSIAMGDNVRSTAAGAVALGGQSNTANGFRSVVMGFKNVTNAEYSLAQGTCLKTYLKGQTAYGASDLVNIGEGFAQHSQILATKNDTLTTGGTTTLSLDGTGVTNLIIPDGNNRMWNVQVRWVAVVTAITGTATGVTVGDTKSSTDLLAVAKRAGTTTVSAHTSAGTHAIETIAGSLTAANIAYTAGASQEMAITFTGPTFAGGGSVTMRVVAAISLTEVAY